MRGLLYREWYIARKFYYSNIAVVLLFTMMGYLVKLSMLYGNLAHADADVTDTVNALLVLVQMYLIPFVAYAMLGNNGVELSDYTSGWKRFGYYLPVSSLQQTAVKFILKGILIVGTTVYSSINCMVFSKLSGMSYRMDDFLNLMLIMTYYILMDTVTMPLLLRAKNKKDFSLAQMAGFIVVFGLIAALILYMAVVVIPASMSVEHSEDEYLLNWFKDFRSSCIRLIPLALLLLLGIDFFASYQMIRRRGN